MTADEWEKIKALFDAALKVAPAERLPWLQEACGSRLDLFDTVRQLIADYEQSSWPDPRSDEAGPVFAAGDLVASRFRIIRPLAHGGMGEVYEAADNSMRGLRIALKTLRPGLASEQQALERFKREVWVAREMAHPGICRVFDLVEHTLVGPDGSKTVIPCLTMKLLDGESLAARVTREGPLSIDQSLPIIRQLVECVQAMHDSQIVHRDITSSNIMLVPGAEGNTQVILIDFGLAKPIHGRMDAWETKTQQQAGVPYFVPPEALRGEPVGPPADVYALGLVIDHMVTTRPAYRYESIEELFWRKLHDRPESPSARSIDLPPAWERIILRCLERDPAKRPASAMEVIGCLECTQEQRLWELCCRAARAMRSPFEAPSRRTWISGISVVVVGAAGFAVYEEGRNGELPTSILVMPFENVSIQQGTYEALCIGTREELIRRLSYVKGLSVLEAPRDWNPDARALEGIRFMLRGMLHDYQGKPQLAIQLTDNKTSHVIWQESFDPELGKPLQLESDLTNKTIDEIQGRVGLGLEILSMLKLRPKIATDSPSKSDEAVVAYQRGRALWDKRTLPDALQAVKAYEDAIRVDPKYALAYAALADVQHTLLTYSYGSTRELMNRAVEYAEKAISIDGSFPECHVARAAAKQNLWAWEDSDSSYRVAIDKHPQFARAHHWYAGLLLQFGKFEAALARAGVGLKLAPFDFPAHSNHGMYLWYAGRPKDAVRSLEFVVQKSNFLFAHVHLGSIYAYLASQASEPDATGYFNKSMEHAGTVRVQELGDTAGPEPPFLKWSDWMFVEAYASRGDSASANNYMHRLRQGFETGKVPATVLAWGYAAMKQWKKTLEMLEYGADHQEREMLYVKVHPLLRPMGRYAGYNSILKRMRLA